MKQFKALLKKDWQVNWKQLLLPAWFMAVVYIFSIMIYVYVFFKYGSDLKLIFSANEMHLDMLIWGIHFGSSLVLGLLAIVTSMTLTDILNQDHIKKCEIFHFSIPMSFKKILSEKLFFIIIGPFMVYLILAFVNSILMNLASAILGYSDFAIGLNGVINSIPYVLLALLVFPPLNALFAGIQRKNAFGTMLITILTLDIILIILRTFTSFPSFSFYNYFTRVLWNPFYTTAEMMSGNYAGLGLFGWSHVFSWDSLLRIGISMVMIAVTYFLLKRKELS